jgi:hypothetical protein
MRAMFPHPCACVKPFGETFGSEVTEAPVGLSPAPVVPAVVSYVVHALGRGERTQGLGPARQTGAVTLVSLSERRNNGHQPRRPAIVLRPMVLRDTHFCSV